MGVALLPRPLMTGAKTLNIDIHPARVLMRGAQQRCDGASQATPVSGDCRARRQGLATLRRTKRERTQQVGEGNTVPFIATPILPSPTTWDGSEDCLGGRGGQLQVGSTFPPVRVGDRAIPSAAVARRGGRRGDDH